MDEVQVLADQIENLSLQLRDAVKSLKTLLEFKPDSWQGYTSVPLYKEQPSMQEIYERRQAALERYRQQYEQEFGNSEEFESGEDEIDASKFENPNLHTQQKQLQMPIESYYTERCSDES